MKEIKRCLYIVIFAISLFIININIKAYTINSYNGTDFNEEYIYNRFSSDTTFNIDTYSNIFCYSYDLKNIYCYAFHNDVVITNNKGYITSNSAVSCYEIYDVIYRPSSNKLTFYESCYKTLPYSSDYSYFSNFNIDFFTTDENIKMNVLNFNSYMSNNSEEELEVTIKGTEILNFMLDKTRNIYEVLIANQIFILCLGVLLSYLIFIVIYRLIRK